MQVIPTTRLIGELSFAGDKSLSHRLVLISLLNKGEIEITNLSDCEDVQRSLHAVKQLGVSVSQNEHSVLLKNRGISARQGHYEIDCGNSGTTARLLTGILAGQPGFYRLVGDESLSRRPMQRIIEPLVAMNANISARDTLPIEIAGSRSLRAINFHNVTGSAQVRSAVILAALQAFGETGIAEPCPGRDHTERMLTRLNLPLRVDNEGVTIKGPAALTGNYHFAVPGDISSAAFFAVAASIVEGSELTLKNVLLNSSRTGFIRVLQRMGASISTHAGTSTWEPYGDVHIKSARLNATSIAADEVPSLIDELPVLAVAMAFAPGKSRVSGARELRHKETDRIRDLISQLRLVGVDCQQFDDGFEINGPTAINRVISLDSCNDHRLAMSFAVMALNSSQGLNIKNTDCINISFPDFFATLHRCAQQKN
ncbi:MAG: 3-phosphoshikimate 1-carboxyvinyltransferase [Candidatus Riflebacteria bacterium HGW-Riflebacteria-1]|jgi:3-phosphoshikimate 1-carboxyvinyltransferase|nr:MAG: 3-phosphoshikimate 1-carboxyvinyltransferase [Candidatus Riflebacteria bacterium HGW-Riflebacteria-1]